PGAYLGQGGVPHVTCLYPGTQGELAETLYQLAQVWSYGGEWVHAFLYKKFGYQLVAAPNQCGDCNTSCSLTINPADPTDGQAVTITCTVTNTDGSPTKGQAPAGTVTFYVDGVAIGTCTLPDVPEPYTQNWESCSIGWTATCEPQDTHTIEAMYTPSEPDFAPTSCATSFTVQCGVPCITCPQGFTIPKTIYATISDAGGCSCVAGTYPLVWNPLYGGWNYRAAPGPCSYDEFGIVYPLPLAIVLQCYEGGFILDLSCGSIGGAYYSTNFSCAPFQVEFANCGQPPPPQSCCNGTVNVSITP
ncbi:MAG TPA: Ig-like domain-containing protein, partial [Gemmataceae bacterium]|nr:Ig-like domain-containing protein [Gemmataceae bacterium]